MSVALNQFSRRFADRLLAAHPDWQPLLQSDPHGFPPPGSLQVVVPSPVAGRQLLIRTYGDQVTVDFGPDGWHQHFLPEAHDNDASALSAALRFIDGLLADRVVVATRYVAGRRLWSRAIEASPRGPRFGTVKIISWSGGRDEILPRKR